MDVSPQLLREVEFREAWRGYNHDEVDEFLERLAVAVEGLQAQLRDAIRRADAVERRSGDGSENADELRRTLVLAQRTADAAIEEARTKAVEIIAEAENQAAVMLDEANRNVDAVLGVLVEHRQMLEDDVKELNAYVLQYRKRLQRELREGMSWLERSGRLEAGPLPELSDISSLPDSRSADRRMQEREDSGDTGFGLTSPDDSREQQGQSEVLRFDDTAAYDMTTSVASASTSVGEDTGPHKIVVDSAAAGSDSGARADETSLDGDNPDPFLAELRRAVTEAEPLGPRSHEVTNSDDLLLDGDLYDEGFSSRFRRRRS